jgi:adenosylhomocysteine nucleosidase
MTAYRLNAFAACSLLATVAAPALAQEAAGQLDATPRIAVMSAFAPEWVVLQEALSDRRDHVVNGVTLATGTMEGKPVVLFLSGVSMVNAAMTTQMVIDRFAIDTIVFSGIAGGVDPSLSIGDVIVPDRWAQYLEAVFARETEEGFAPPGFLSTPFPNYGMIHPREVDVARDGAEPEQKFWFDIDPELLDLARSVAETAELEDCASDNACLASRRKSASAAMAFPARPSSIMRISENMSSKPSRPASLTWKARPWRMSPMPTAFRS